MKYLIIACALFVPAWAFAYFEAAYYSESTYYGQTYYQGYYQGVYQSYYQTSYGYAQATYSYDTGALGQTTQFRLMCGIQQSNPITITVNPPFPPPSGLSLDYGTSPVCGPSGTSQTFRWTATTGAAYYKITINGVETTVPGGGSATSYSYPTTSGTAYTWSLKVCNSSNYCSNAATGPGFTCYVPPPTCTMSATPPERFDDDTAPSVLTYSILNTATSASIDQGIGVVNHTMPYSTPNVSPVVNTTYTMTVANATGSNQCQATVTIKTPAIVGQLTAAPSRVRKGGSTTLSWTTGGMTSCTLRETTSGATLSTAEDHVGLLVSNIQSAQNFQLSCNNGAFVSTKRVPLVPFFLEL